MASVRTAKKAAEKRGLREQIVLDYKKNKYILFMAIPVFLWFVIFCYLPIFGIIIAFKDYSPGLGVIASPWAGLRHFKDFLSSTYTLRIFKNTLLLNLYGLLWGFPAPIILALLLNEIRCKSFKVGVQILSYIPYFISMVVVCGIVVNFTASGGLISRLAAHFIGEEVNLLLYPRYYRSIYIASDLWQQVGWGSIIYMAALAGIDQSLYEAATIDGCSFGRIFASIILPLLKPILATIAIISFKTVWNDYLLPMVFTISTPSKAPLVVGVVSLKNTGDAATSWNLMLAGTMISIIPMMVLYLCLNRYFVEGMTNGAVKG